MRVFVAGATGAVGSRLVPQLIDAGHEVIGAYNAPASAELLHTLGAKPVKVDLLDPGAVRKAVLEIRLDAIVHQTVVGDAPKPRPHDQDKPSGRLTRLRAQLR